ncbi:hypothetical protein HZZ02_09400, partial [Streptococcus danieliae]|nr:hypothetical protein [Streptococcus danieliae]
MVKIKKSTNLPHGGIIKTTITLWYDKVFVKQKEIILKLSRPCTKFKYITISLDELKDYQNAVKVFEKIYRHYSHLADKTGSDYARDIASKLLDLGLIGG